MKNIIVLIIFIGSLFATAKGQDLQKTPAPKIVHIVLFKFKKSTSTAQIQDLKDEILKQKDTITGLLEISFGLDFTGRAKDFSYAETAVFRDRKSLDEFNRSDYHKQLIIKQIKPILEDILVLDYEQ